MVFRDVLIAAALALGIAAHPAKADAYDYYEQALAQKALKKARDSPDSWARMEPTTGWKGYEVREAGGGACIFGIKYGRLNLETICEDADGMVTSMTSYKDGLKHGLETKYVEGELRQSIEWSDGRKHGTEKMYDTDGSLFSEEKYDHGRLLLARTNMGDGVIDVEDHVKGVAYSHYSNGQLKSMIGLYNGEYHGNGSGWYSDGKLEWAGSYAEGKKHGRWALHQQDGGMTIENYDTGIITSSATYDSGGKLLTEFWR